ncbi:2584_t:CDS:2, partial [Dentiscutata erythropus]
NNDKFQDPNFKNATLTYIFTEPESFNIDQGLANSYLSINVTEPDPNSWATMQAYDTEDVGITPDSPYYAIVNVSMEGFILIEESLD